MKATARPFLSAVKCRSYASQAAAEQASLRLPRGESRLTRMQDGSILAAVENNSPVVRLAFMYNAGSRYESKSQAGLTHTLRNATNLSTKLRTGFGMTKHMLQLGSDLTVITSREHMIFTSSCTRDKLYDCLDILLDVARNPAHKHWEIRDLLTPSLKLDLAKYHNDPGTMLMEALHEVTFRDTLGNSLYIPEHKIGSFNFVDLQQFSKEHQTPANMAIVAVGAEPEEFAFQFQHRYGEKNPKPSTVPTKAKATYGGGEKRIDVNSQLTHAAVVTEGASLGSKDLIPLALLQRIMGIGPSVKYSDHIATSKINKAVSQVAKGPFSTSTININYSDSGLFGFYAVGQPNEMDGILKTAAAAFGSATKEAISEKDLAGAKGNLKAAIHMALEDQGNVLMELGTQALLTGEIISPQQISDEIDRTTVADVQNVAKKVINGKPSMVAVGNLAHTPYLDQII